MTKVKPRAGSEHFPFTKPVLVGGLGFTFSVVLLLFQFLCRSLFFAEIVQSPCVPAGGAGTGFYVRELRELEGLGREHLLVPLGSPGVPRTLLAGSPISPRSLFPQSHAWIRSVALGSTIVSLSPILCFPPQPVGAWPRLPTQDRLQGPQAMPCPHSVPVLLGSPPPPQCSLL